MDAQLGFKVSFKDFFTKDSFLWMQYRFRMEAKSINKKDMEAIRMNMEEDAFFNMYVKQEINYDFQLVIDSIAPDFPADWIFKEVLDYNVRKIAENYIETFEKKIETKALYGIHQKADFAKHERNKLPKVESQLDKLDYDLLQELKLLLLEQYQFIHEFLNNFIVETIKDNERLNFKLIRNDIILLFHLLQENGNIEKCEKQRLGSLIDNLFNYQNKDGEYETIKDSRKVLSDLRKGNKQLQKSYNRLKEIFHNQMTFEPSAIE